MSLLDKLWDDTLAGPQPETGLGRLRKPLSFGSRPSALKVELLEDAASEVPKVTRSIMIRRPVGSPSSPGIGSASSSPSSGSTPPVSPFFGGREWSRIRRKSSSDAYDSSTGIGVGSPRAPSSTHEA